jgi:hypothetical protein
MNGKKLLGAGMAVGLGLLAITSTSDVSAQAKKPAAKGAPVAMADPPMTKKPVALTFPGIQWGMPPSKVADVIDRMLDEDYKPLYKEVQPGVKMKALDAQLAEDKSAFRRSRIDFGRLPTGVDASPLRGEFSYLNKEAMMTLTRKGENIHFFFIQERLWKMIGEHSLSGASPYGKDYQEAITKLAAQYGAPGRVLQPDANRGALEVDWKDGNNNHVRAIQRGEKSVALAVEDLTTVQSLSSLRTNKPSEESAVDPAVAAAVRKGEDPKPPPDKDKKAPPKKK